MNLKLILFEVAYKVLTEGLEVQLEWKSMSHSQSSFVILKTNLCSYKLSFYKMDFMFEFEHKYCWQKSFNCEDLEVQLERKRMSHSQSRSSSFVILISS